MVRTIFFLSFLAASSVYGANTANKNQPANAAERAALPVTTFEDVEALNDRISQYDGRKVKVTGEIQNRLDGTSFVLESGGILNDEIVVLESKELKGKKAKRAGEDAKVSVTGTIRLVPVVEIRRELSWDLNPQVEAELQKVQAYLVADQIVETR